MNYTMTEVCAQTGLTYDALKFYCNKGLIPNVKRDKNNYRIFDDRDIAWIKSLICLKKCDMSIAEIKQYIELCQQGKSSILVRQAVLTEKQAELQTKIDELNQSIEFINYKLQLYQDMLDGKKAYYSNLAVKDETD